MIKTTTKNLSLVTHTPGRGKRRDRSSVPTVNIFIDQGRIQFSRYAIEEMKLEGKLIRFFSDDSDQSIIGWKVIDRPTVEEVKREYRCKVHNNGVWRISINKLIHQMTVAGRKWSGVYRNVPIERYKEKGETYFFVSLEDVYKE